ncbi:MAG: helix-turn-helix domain-containing protein [bacterium]|nr:helix-turn-helix domain-containing protein [bacterium]
MDKELLSTTDVAKILGISRIAVFKKVKAGKIKARRAGRNFIIARKELPEILGTALGKARKKLIDSAIKKTVKEYGQTLKLLGKE